MDENASVNNAGLNSLSGYSYQIKIFIYLLTQIGPGQQVEFETLDDVAVTNIAEKDSLADSCIKYKINSDTSAEVFQIKQTNVTPSSGKKVLYNWLLALNSHPEISKFTLYVDSNYSCTANTFDGNSQREFNAIIASNANPTALVSRVKELYKDRRADFDRDYVAICGKKNIESICDIDRMILDQLRSVFHAEAPDVGEVFYERRVSELLTRLCARIMDAASRRLPFKCGRPEYMQLCEEIERNISPEQFLPDYESFSQVYGHKSITDEIISSREYRQLMHCNLQAQSVLEHLRWEQYYQNIHQKYLRDAKRETIIGIESVAKQKIKVHYQNTCPKE